MNHEGTGRIAFRDSSKVDLVLNKLGTMETDYVLDLEDAVIVVRDMNGKAHLKQSVDVFGGATTFTGICFTTEK